MAGTGPAMTGRLLQARPVSHDERYVRDPGRRISIHHGGLQDADHGGAARGIADTAHRMGTVAAVAQAFPSLRLLGHAADLDLELSVQDGQALHGAALMAVGVEYAAGLGLHVVPLQPLDGLEPADDG